MTNPWDDGPRHESWASNTMLTFIILLVCIVATVVTDIIGEPPNYLVALLGTSAGAFFAALGSDRQKKAAELTEKAERAEVKADQARVVARRAEAKADAVGPGEPLPPDPTEDDPDEVGADR